RAAAVRVQSPPHVTADELVIRFTEVEWRAGQRPTGELPLVLRRQSVAGPLPIPGNQLELPVLLIAPLVFRDALALAELIAVFRGVVPAEHVRRCAGHVGERPADLMARAE